jgi:hypothetical protein
MKQFTMLVLLTVLVFGSVGAVSAGGNSTAMEVSGTVWNPCTGEDVYFSGTVHITQLSNADGTYMVSNINYANMLGTGVDTGNLYKYAGDTSQVVYQDSDFAPLTSTVQQNIRWVTAGGQNDLTVRVFLHITWNANGEITAYRYDFGELTCS